MRLGKTNEELKQFLGKDAICTLVYGRLVKMSAVSGDVDWDPIDCVEYDLVDPVRVFVKNELHSAEKVQQGRMRLISSVSCIDQMVERVLCGDQNLIEIENWSTIPSKPGLGLDDAGLSILINNLADFKDPVETDVSGWDWSVKQWMLDADALCRSLLGGCAPNSHYHKMLRLRAALLGRSVLVLSSGEVWVQDVPGIMKSGSYLTSATNSKMRVIVGYCAGTGKIQAAGDDAVEEWCRRAAERYKEFGLLVKEYKRSTLSTGIEFCSIIFKETVRQCAPARWAKVLGTMLQKLPRNFLHQQELLTSLRYDLRNSTQLSTVLDLVMQSGWCLHKDGEENPIEEEESC